MSKSIVIFLGMILGFVCSLAFAAPSTIITEESLKPQIEHAMRKGKSMKDFYVELAQQHGGKAVAPLLAIASNEKNTDETRWAALFGVARIAGRESSGVLKKFMSNSSWMLRDAALKTAAAVDAKELNPAIDARLKDDALIVRTTAVQTIEHLKLKSSAPRLVDALFDPMNYHHDKALWIHKYILHAIEAFKYEAAAPRLVELLEKTKDAELKERLVQTLEKITGKSFPNKSIQEQVYLWKRNILSDVTF